MLHLPIYTESVHMLAEEEEELNRGVQAKKSKENMATWPRHKKKIAEVGKEEEEIKRIVRMADRNGDGVLNKKELEDAFRQLGAWFPGWRANRGLKVADSDNDGVISQDEMEELIKYCRSKYGFK